MQPIIIGPDSDSDNPLCTVSDIELTAECEGKIKWLCTRAPTGATTDQLVFSAPEGLTTKVTLPLGVKGQWAVVAVCCTGE